MSPGVSHIFLGDRLHRTPSYSPTHISNTYVHSADYSLNLT